MKTININLGNSATLKVPSCDNCSHSAFVSVRMSKEQRLISIVFSWKQTWFQGTQQCRHFMFMLSVSLYALSLLFGQFPNSNTDQQQCKRCFVLELSNIKINILITAGYSIYLKLL